jgi:hypothetical protein
MNRNVFIAHSNKFIELTKWFSEFLKTRKLNPIVVELTPNAGRVWTVPEKESHLLSLCASAIVIATPDELQDNEPVTRLDVTFEIGRLVETKKTIFLKESTVKLPTCLNPIYTEFSLKNPQNCLKELDKELISIFGDEIDTTVPFKLEPPKWIRTPVLLRGKELAPERPLEIQQTVIELFVKTDKAEQGAVARDIFTLLDEEDENKRWVAASLIEEIMDFDSQLVPRDIIIKMAKDQFFSVRTCAAVSLYKLANTLPGFVPLDLLIKLASPSEDWYVYTPARAALQTLAHKNAQALEFLLAKSRTEYAEDFVPLLYEVVKNDPKIITKESLNGIIDHQNKSVRELAEKIIELVKSRGSPGVARYSPF